MNKFIDKFVISFIIFLIVFIITRLVKLSLLQCFFIALASQIIILCMLKIIYKNKITNQSYFEFFKTLALNDKDYVINLYNNAYPNQIQIKDKYILLNEKAYFLHLKFSNMSLDSLIEIYKICRKNNIDKATIVSKDNDKKLLSYNHIFDDIIFEFDDYKDFYKKLKKENLLPTNCHKKNKIPYSVLLKITLTTAFQRKNCKHFLFAGFILCIFSFITPLSTYYLVLAGISVILAIICLIKP